MKWSDCCVSLPIVFVPAVIAFWGLHMSPLNAQVPLFVAKYSNRGTLLDAQLSNDGKLVASVFEGSVQVDNIETHQQVLRTDIGPHVRSLRACFSPDGKYLAIGGGVLGRLGVIAVHDLTAGSRIYFSAAHTDCVQAISFSKNGRVLAGLYSGALFLHDLRDKKVNAVGSQMLGAIWIVCSSDDGRHMLIGAADGISLLEGQLPTKVTAKVLFRDGASQAVISADGRYVGIVPLRGPRQEPSFILDVVDGHKAVIDSLLGVRGMSFSSSDTLCTISGTGPVPPAHRREGNVQRFKIRSGADRVSVTLQDQIEGQCDRVICDETGARCLLADGSGHLEVWKTDVLFRIHKANDRSR